MKQLTKTWDCKGCIDPCCRFHPEMPQFVPIFTKEEVESLVSHGIKKDNFYPIDEKHFTVVFREKEGIFNLCPFVKDKVLCAIYENRPLDCRIWPFAIIKRGDGVYLAIDSREICIPVKRLRGKREYKEYIRYLIDYFEGDEMIERLSKYPRLISDDHPDFEVIGKLDKLTESFP